MAKLDLSEMTLDDLKKLRKDVEKAIGGYEDRKRREAMAAAQAAIAGTGFALGDLVGIPSTKGRKTTAAPKYRHPENPTLTWSGRGRKPAWFHEAIEAGLTEEHMLIGRG